MTSTPHPTDTITTDRHLIELTGHPHLRDRIVDAPTSTRIVPGLTEQPPGVWFVDPSGHDGGPTTLARWMATPPGTSTVLPIPTVLGHVLARVDGKWEVLHARTGRRVAGWANAHGRIIHCLWTADGPRSFDLARLILLALGAQPAPGDVVRHLDDCPSNIDRNNLTFGTRQENAQDALRNARCGALIRHSPACRTRALERLAAGWTLVRCASEGCTCSAGRWSVSGLHSLRRRTAEAN